MKELERKHQFVLETAKLIFQRFPNLIFIGGTALNTFYLDYRFSEDLDIGYIEQNQKREVEDFLSVNNYSVTKSPFKFRDIISMDGLSVKLDIIEYSKKYSGFVETTIGNVTLKTLTLDEFILSKSISFFTREEITGLARDAFDLFAIQKKYSSVYPLLKRTKEIIRHNIVSLNYNLELFYSRPDEIQSAVIPYLKENVEYSQVLKFLKKLRVFLDE